MSGGSMDYFSYKMEEYADRLEDKELIDLAKDLAALFHSKEWCDSGDTGIGSYNEDVENFKKKWFKTPRSKRLKSYIDSSVNNLKTELHNLVGEKDYCRDCVYYHPVNGDVYGECDKANGYLRHRCYCCEEFKRFEYEPI